MSVLYINTTSNDENIPRKAHIHDAAFDLCASEDGIVPAKGMTFINTDFSMHIPDGYACLVLSRSGLAKKAGVFILNSPGLIDPGYLGNIGLILGNLGDEDYHVQKGERMAQLLFIETKSVYFGHIDEYENTKRGTNGFGSSGR